MRQKAPRLTRNACGRHTTMDKLDAELRFGQQALDLRAYRQTVLSSNIANVDTPGYKARDIDFQASLTRSLGARQGAADAGSTPGSLAMSATHAGHLAGLASAATAAASAQYGAAKFRVPNQESLDGNTVELDTERVNFADNALHYQTGMTVVSQQIKTMLAALGNG